MRRALATLVDHGLLEHVKIYSLLWRVRSGHARQAIDGLLNLVKAYSPDVILMQHLGGTGVDDRVFAELRSLNRFALIYHEADPYSRWRHRLPPEARSAGRNADVVFTVGRNEFRSNFLRSGSTDVRWCSSVYDPGRFGNIPIPTGVSREYDVVVIANRTQARSPFTGHPNARQRVELVHRLAERFGPRFAVYGKGWTGPSAQGPVNYDLQHRAIHSGWITANWDHYAKEDAYFSDRLPTTLATGSVHLTTLHEGFQEIFPENSEFLHLGRSPRTIVDIAEDLLATFTPNDFVSTAVEGQRFADLHFRQDDQLVSFLNFDGCMIDPIRARSLWEKDSRMLEEL